MSTSIPKSLNAITDTWSPHLLASVNGQHVKIAKIDGSFVFHAHPESDELFYVLSGQLTLKFEDRADVAMRAGDVYVVPRGVRHCPVADDAEIMLVEAADTVNTGDAPASARTKQVNTRFHADC
ncbi:RmlC-like jelly roll fold protein [Cordyceps fumosorosea ARSEF 2679]|uniref:RmlC-like jelly roll fold protein n=1 Tax=Cordyceps fumosorosea (strain ARSEF 2679) TaxID=1081104 RepID=A0A168BR20_CORFA|nr:RmlC-like jelly roll fold protein [Cordyceps fumosorosea ARSEF 2679]OAA70440.1 RmlC-like jelly roll fold protein [Cordyceps fumosorosea ARSEF 2679]